MADMFLNSFEVILPKNRILQSDLLDWLTNIHIKAAHLKGTKDDSVPTAKIFKRYAVKETQISARYFECDDTISAPEEIQIYDITEQHPEGRNLSERIRFFSQRCNSVFQKIYDLSDKANRPDHLIHVTCTGYISPSAPQQLISRKNWGKATEITHAYHMGCYASMPAIRIAAGLVHVGSIAEPHFRADIVHTEMCGLHMNPSKHSPEQMVVQSLFADGHIKYSVTAEKQPGKNLKLVAIAEKLISDSSEDMSWVPAPWGMEMNLSREVPAKIKSELKGFLDELLFKARTSYERAQMAIYAVHPGGPKIIDSVQEVLELSDSQVSQSRKVLYERGNMSSATLPHVWHEILQNDHPAGTLIISFAFGPGLTLFGSVFEVQ